MSPLKRQIPAEVVNRIEAAVRGKADADAELKAAVVDALKADAPIRQVAKLAGISDSTTYLWGKEGGWPTAKQQARRRAEKDRKAS